jgi:RNA polymerase sigma factor (sigma-70 family)
MTKEELRAYRDLRAELEQLGRLSEELDARLYAPGSPKYDGLPRTSSGGPSDGLTAKLAKRAELRQLYDTKAAELYGAALRVEQALADLPARERTLCRAYYLEGMTWEQVCGVMSYSWSQVHRIHADALRRLTASR